MTHYICKICGGESSPTKANKKLSYHTGTTRHAMLVKSCCFTRYGS